jgi:hypothetical protein
MTFKQFAIETGLIGRRETWQAKHRQQVSALLKILGEVALQSGERLAFDRIVNSHTKLPGEPAHEFAREFDQQYPQNSPAL